MTAFEHRYFARCLAASLRKRINMHNNVLGMVSVGLAEDVDAAYMDGIFLYGNFKGYIRAKSQVEGVYADGFCF